jgi:hypothetical protein
VVSITDKDMARYRATMESTFPDTATIARTSTTVKCRVDISPRFEQIEGYPKFVFQRRYLISVPYGTDVDTGDLVTVGAKSYRCLSPDTGKSYATRVQFQASSTDAGDAFIEPTETAVFEQRVTNERKTVPVTILPVDRTAIANQDSWSSPTRRTGRTSPSPTPTLSVRVIASDSRGCATTTPNSPTPCISLAGYTMAYFRDQ